LKIRIYYQGGGAIDVERGVAKLVPHWRAAGLIPHLDNVGVYSSLVEGERAVGVARAAAGAAPGEREGAHSGIHDAPAESAVPAVFTVPPLLPESATSQWQRG